LEDVNQETTKKLQASQEESMSLKMQLADLENDLNGTKFQVSMAETMAEETLQQLGESQREAAYFKKTLTDMGIELKNYKDHTLNSELALKRETDKLKNEYDWYDD
jgi:hypothetical protein